MAKDPTLSDQDLDPILIKAGFEEYGGGRNFISYRHPDTGRTFYLFGSPKGSGPSDAHWTEVDGAEDIVAGGFSEESLERYLAAPYVKPSWTVA